MSFFYVYKNVNFWCFKQWSIFDVYKNGQFLMFKKWSKNDQFLRGSKMTKNCNPMGGTENDVFLRVFWLIDWLVQNHSNSFSFLTFLTVLLKKWQFWTPPISILGVPGTRYGGVWKGPFWVLIYFRKIPQKRGFLGGTLCLNAPLRGSKGPCSKVY